MWVLRNWLRAVMFSGGLEGGYVGAPTRQLKFNVSGPDHKMCESYVYWTVYHCGI